ncbi:hypothetical protein B0H66DRAFT_288459 [Apodospora peruviana]|uniref:Uncharacterized protein n=1 Tax=Apodospora peruviana TaxID=516989 RepID=A0AAE0I0Q0_9PEZI|nr:hypothetical protein B0H66DRAFT_288459 [Apodospora peruviana]
MRRTRPSRRAWAGDLGKGELEARTIHRSSVRRREGGAASGPSAARRRRRTTRYRSEDNLSRRPPRGHVHSLRRRVHIGQNGRRFRLPIYVTWVTHHLDKRCKDATSPTGTVPRFPCRVGGSRGVLNWARHNSQPRSSSARQRGSDFALKTGRTVAGGSNTTKSKPNDELSLGFLLHFRLGCLN